MTDDGGVRLQMHIGGHWVDAVSGETLEQHSPVTGQLLAVLPRAGREDARRAVAAANRGRRWIAGMPIFDRARLCHRVADQLETRISTMARELSLEQGKPLTEAMDELRFAAGLYRDAAEAIAWLETSVLPSPDPCKRVLTLRQPHGVVAILTPWNYPVSIPSEYLSAALVTGNAVVWKPAPTASLIASRLLECLLEAGVPEGVVNLITGETEPGDEIVVSGDTHAVCFTGSPATGEVIARRAGPKPLLLELGGNGPTIILADADLEVAVRGAAFGAFSN